MGTKAANGNSNHILGNEDDMEAKRVRALKWLKDNFGKHKCTVQLTKDELDKLAMEMTEEESHRIAKEYWFE